MPPPPADDPLPVRLVVIGAALGLGLLSGLVGSFVQAVRVAGLPVGLVIALALTAAAVAVGGLLGRSVMGAAAALGGWVLVCGVLAQYGPGRDLVLPGRPLSYAWLGGGMALGIGLLLLPYPRLAARVDGPPDGQP